MNKSDLIAKTHALLNKSCYKPKSKTPCEELISRASTENVINTILSAIAEGLKLDGSVQLIGFGTFTINQRAARQGVNPRTGEKIRIAASKSIRFKAGSKLKEIL
ncbi:MAG: HU family DNA-binding protein [Puniceicoccales bacterium]|jgi:DNA-binding protein HU-beta|nr:HU family DNA-binding protein [Puniceicoccales bacterium]